ncbi:hypothetical protein Dimus_024536, partial [Dionaea muscipula]
GIEQKLIDIHNRGIEIEIKWRPTEEKQSNWNLIELTDDKACLLVFTAQKPQRLAVELLLVVIVVALAEGLCRLSMLGVALTRWPPLCHLRRPSQPPIHLPASAVIGISDGKAERLGERKRNVII